MLGYTLFMHSLSRQDLDTYAAVRDSASLTNWFPAHALGKIIQKVDAYNNDSITRAVAISQPDIIINCIGLVQRDPTGIRSARGDSNQRASPPSAGHDLQGDRCQTDSHQHRLCF